MEDNGLLQYYRDLHNVKNGFLCEDVVKSLFGDEIYVQYNVSKYIDKNGKVFYSKRPRLDKEVDSEVLLSQAYSRAGLNNAIYTPVILNDQTKIVKELRRRNDDYAGSVRLISNNVAPTDEYKLAVFSEDVFDKNLFTRGKFGKGLIAEEYFSRRAIRNLIVMHAMDLSSCNIDRRLFNFYTYKPQGANGIIDDLPLIDNGYTYQAMKEEDLFDEQTKVFSSKGIETIFCNYLNRRTYTTMSRVKSFIKENECVQSVVSSNELAEILGGVDIKGCARDIEETIGYKVDETVVGAFDASFYSTAEELIK